MPSRELGRVEARLGEASMAYRNERYAEAYAIARELARLYPGVAVVRELAGLAAYRLGNWQDARRELTQFAERTGSVDQHPVLADCERALGNHERAAEYWQELRQTGAGSDVLAEGRLVMAGSLADRERFAEAIELLARSARPVRSPRPRHLRQWYALADLYERSGDAPRARELFERIVRAEPDFVDAVERMTALR